jgi:hypothetical protein
MHASPTAPRASHRAAHARLVRSLDRRYRRLPVDKRSRTARKALLSRIIGGIGKNLSSMRQIPIASRTFTPAQLAGVFQAELDAIAALEQVEAQRKKARLDERKAYKDNRPIHAALELFVRGAFSDAVHLGHFGYAPEKSRKTRVSTKMQAIAKAKATREARGTRGSVQKRRIKG